MTARQRAGAASARKIDFASTNWSEAERSVRRLQVRIAKAERERRHNKVKALQWLLTHSFYAKALAVRRVSTNSGRNTPGVDGVIWNTPGKCARGLASLKRRGYRPQPLRRVLIPKANGKTRPLGIPTMKDRAMQALYLLALEPVAETTADPNSYGFRPRRSARDAVMQCRSALAGRYKAVWVLDADISGCFDAISHEWLLANIPMDKAILHKWLKSGFVWKGETFATEAGTPQGGIISPVLANMALDGMERLLRGRYGDTGRTSRKTKVNLIRYADDFVITGATFELALEARALVEGFLARRGLVLSEEKTRIVHIGEGFDFLGWTVRKFDGKLLVRPAAKNVRAFLRTVRTILHEDAGTRQETVIHRLNPILRGWANYHRNQAAKKTFCNVDHAIWCALWRWARRRHPNKSGGWVKKRYFSRIGSRDWVFCCAATDDKTGERTLVRLLKLSDTPIRRYPKVKALANPYDPVWGAYFADRKQYLRALALQGRANVPSEDDRYPLE